MFEPEIELVREQLSRNFPEARLRVRDPGNFQPVAFMLRWSPQREARVRVAWGQFQAHHTGGPILPEEAIRALEVGVSILVTPDGIVNETKPE